MRRTQKNLIFVYGTLKRNHPNHFLLEDLISKNDAVYIGRYSTRSLYPLVLGLYGIPYLINLPGSGQQVRGELYAVSKRGLVRLDELEGTKVKHYERLPIEVKTDEEEEEVEESNGVVLAEAYFAHRRFGEKLWERRGKCGMKEYGQNDSVLYVRPRDRPRVVSVVDEIEAFVSSCTG